MGGVWEPHPAALGGALHRLSARGLPLATKPLAAVHSRHGIPPFPYKLLLFKNGHFHKLSTCIITLTFVVPGRKYFNLTRYPQSCSEGTSPERCLDVVEPRASSLPVRPGVNSDVLSFPASGAILQNSQVH